MDAEQSLMLLHLKSDLKEVLKLTREKSDELLQAIRINSDKVSEKAEDLEYYISSMLDISREIKKLFSKNVTQIWVKPNNLAINQADFDEMIQKLSGFQDMKSLQEILAILESWEHYELCAVVRERIKTSPLPVIK